MIRILMLLFCAGVMFLAGNYSAFADDLCDECTEGTPPVPVPWSTQTFTIDVSFSNGKIWEAVYKTRECNGQLHLKIIALKSPQTTPNHLPNLFYVMAGAVHKLLYKDFVLLRLQASNIPMIPGQSIKVRLFIGSCWIRHPYVYNGCFDDTEEIFVPCSRACCIYEANVHPSCDYDIVNESNNFISDGMGCIPGEDPDVCYPPVTPNPVIHKCESFCIDYGNWSQK